MSNKLKDSETSSKKRRIYVENDLDLIKLILDENPSLKNKVSRYYKKNYPKLSENTNENTRKKS